MSITNCTRVQTVPKAAPTADNATITLASTANALVDTLGAEPIWLTWAAQEADGGRVTKIPCRFEGGRQKNISATNVELLAPYQDLVGEIPKMQTVGYSGMGGIGFSIRHRNDIECVDFDHCVKDGTITNTEIAAFVTAANTYVELSPSGTGLHVVFRVEGGKPERGIKSKIRDTNQTDIEMQTNCTYYTFTGNTLENKPPRIVTKTELEELYSTISLVKRPRKDVIDQPSEVEHVDMTNLSDVELLEKAYKSKKGEELKALYVHGDTTRYGGDDSRADMALCGILAFWTGRNTERIDRLFRASALMRPKWDEKRGATTYGGITVRRAVDGCRTTYSAPNEYGADITKLIMGKPNEDGIAQPLEIYENIRRIILNDPLLADRLRFNEFSSTEEVRDLRTNKWVMLPDSFIREAWSHISQKYGWARRVKKTNVTEAVLAACKGNPVHPPREHILSLAWDGVPRLDTWVVRAFDVADEPVMREMGANWLKGLVKRVMNPGCQFDNVLVLEGPQGIGKTSALRILGGEWHVEMTLDVDGKDFIMTLANNLIVEFSEGDIVNRTDMKKLKAVITKDKDQIRFPYARALVTIPRHCVFAMTTNDSEYLKDDTGNRRWWPVRINQAIDLDWLRANRDQLIAEAYVRVMIGKESTYQFSDTKRLVDMQHERRVANEYEEQLGRWYLDLEPRKIYVDGISLEEAHRELFETQEDQGKPAEMTPLRQLQVATMLRGYLRLEPKQVKLDGRNVRRWYPTDQTYDSFNLPTYDDNGKVKRKVF